MIKTFKDERAEIIFNLEIAAGLPHNIQQTALRKLRILDSAHDYRDLKVPPGNRLEKLSGDRRGCLSIRINDQYRVCFEWIDGDAYNVEIIDYH